MSLLPTSGPQPVRPGFSRVIDAIGSDELGATLNAYLHGLCGSVYINGFRIRQARAEVIVTMGSVDRELAHRLAHRYADEHYWRHDPVLALLSGLRTPTAAIARVDPMSVEAPVLREDFYVAPRLLDKLVICARRGDVLYGLSVSQTWESGRFSPAAIGSVAEVADAMLSVLAKHACLCTAPAATPTLTSVARIEEALAGAGWPLSRRERQVCARVLYGMAAPGMALDLGVREESITTYRKRAYRRLGIGTRHELLRRYLGLAGDA